MMYLLLLYAEVNDETLYGLH